MPSRRTTLLLGDAIEQMSRLPTGSVDLVLTSPPYNLGEENRPKGGAWDRPRLSRGYGSACDNLPFDTYVRWQRQVLSECWRLLTPRGAIFYVHKPRVLDRRLVTPLDLNPELPLRQIIVWNRGGGLNCGLGHYAPAHEWVCVFAKPGFRLRDQAASAVGDVWNISPERGNEHPAPFPLLLAQRVLETTPPGVVLDCFMGSGTTGVAAVQLQREFIGIEKDATYMALAKKRITAAKSKGARNPRVLSLVADSSAMSGRKQPEMLNRKASSQSVTFRCPPEMHEALRTLAFARRISIQRLLEQAVAEHLSRQHVEGMAAHAVVERDAEAA
jgi:modification methylase